MENMKDIINRLNNEKFDLVTKIKKARAFRGTDEWKDLSNASKYLLDTQIKIMESYLEVLINRIGLLKEETSDLSEDDALTNKISETINAFIKEMDSIFEEEGEK